MSDQFNQFNPQSGLEPPKPKHPCALVWRGLLFIGAALTFIRNFIGNAVMLLFFLLVFIAYQAANNFKDEAAAIISGQESVPPAVLEAKILYLPLAGTISEMPFNRSQFDNLYRELNQSLSGQQTHELLSIEAALEQALDDDSIEYVLLNLQNMQPLSFAAAQRIGAKLQALTDAGKETAVTADSYSQGAYLIAVHAQHIYLDPLGSVDLKGIGLASLYYSELLDSLSLTPYVFKAGHFKSAVEPYTQSAMSPDVKAEYQQLADGLWQEYLTALSARKSLSRTQVLPPAADYVSALKLYHGDTAMMQFEQNLADELVSTRDLFTVLAHEYGQSADDPFVPLTIDYRDYLQSRSSPAGDRPQDKIAVVYGVGNITEFSQDANSFSADNLNAILSSLSTDADLKAIVLYINSPGGMASASEEIRRHLEQLRSTGIKVVVSIQGMGASGAYWTSTASDRIIATPDSLVGSIGVFSVGLGAHQLLNNFGVYQDGVYTHDFARQPIGEPLNEYSAEVYELSVQHTYRNFIDLVAQARHLSPDSYLSYAEGQVFLASEAQSLGLVDDLGSLDDAIKAAAELAGGELSDFRVVQAALPQDQRLSVLESLFFSVSAKWLPQTLTKALLDLKLADTASSAPLKEQILLQDCLQAPKL